MKTILFILAALAALIVMLAYGCCIVAGRADDAMRRIMREEGIVDHDEP